MTTVGLSISTPLIHCRPRSPYDLLVMLVSAQSRRLRGMITSLGCWIILNPKQPFLCLLLSALPLSSGTPSHLSLTLPKRGKVTATFTGTDGLVNTMVEEGSRQIRRSFSASELTRRETFWKRAAERTVSLGDRKCKPQTGWGRSMQLGLDLEKIRLRTQINSPARKMRPALEGRGTAENRYGSRPGCNSGFVGPAGVTPPAEPH